MQPTENTANAILEELRNATDLRGYVDFDLPIPMNFVGSGSIRLIVLGQDPTIKNPKSKANITTVLNLDKSGQLRRYLEKVCKGLGLDLNQNVFATNLYKNFFTTQPTKIKDINPFQAFLPYWQGLLLEEINAYPDVPIISLGQPLLGALVKDGASPLVREYWGYSPGWKTEVLGPLRYLRSEDNILGRRVFPFPHQPSLAKQFYSKYLSSYTAFLKQNLG